MAVKESKIDRLAVEYPPISRPIIQEIMAYACVPRIAPPTRFVRHLLEGNLADAMIIADGEQLRAVPHMIKLFFAELKKYQWGTKSTVERWLNPPPLPKDDRIEPIEDDDHSGDPMNYFKKIGKLDYLKNIGKPLSDDLRDKSK